MDWQNDSKDVDEIAKRLKIFGSFKNWRPGALRELADRIGPEGLRDLKLGEDLLQNEPDAGDYLYLVDSGQVCAQGIDAQGKLWWDQTYSTGDAFSIQANYDQIYHATSVTALSPARLLVLTPATLGWALSRQPDLWNALVREALASRLRALPLLAPLSDEQIRRLATITRTEEIRPGTTICEPVMNASEASFWFIDWGQVTVDPVPRGGLKTITAGNFFTNAFLEVYPNRLTPVKAEALTRVKLLRIAYSDIKLLLESNEDVSIRLHPPPITSYLRQVKQFSDLQDYQIEALAGITSWEFYPASRTVSQQGVRGSSLRILHRGAAVVRATDDNGRDRPRNYLAPGAYFGISSLFRQDRHHTTVRAVRPGRVMPHGVLRSTADIEADPAQDSEPGAVWFRMRYEDLTYLIERHPRIWAGTSLITALEKERHPYRKYPWQNVDEVIMYDGRRHYIVLLRGLLVPLLILGIEMAIFWSVTRVSGFVTSQTELLVVFITVLPVTAWIVNDYYNDYFVVTNLRVTARDKVVLLYESRTEAPMDQVQDTTVMSGFLGSLLSYGNLVVKTAGNVARVTFDTVPRPHDIQQLLSEQQRRLRAEQQAEQREGLRQQIVVDLHLGLLPRPPIRALPEDIIVQRGWKLWRILRDWWKRQKAFTTKLSAPVTNRLNKMVLIVAQRRLNPKAAGKEFAGGIFGSWWITPEKTVWRKHWVILLLRIWQSVFAWCVVFLVSALMISGTLPGSWWIALILLLPVTGWVWWQYEDWANDIYVVTNEKLIDIERRPLGISESRREGTLDRVQNVSTVIPGFWPNLLNYGNVLIRTAALDEGFTFDKVADPRKVQLEIWKRIENYRTSRAQRDAATQRSQQAQAVGVYHELMEETGRLRPNPEQ